MTRRTRNSTKLHHEQRDDRFVSRGDYQKASGRGLLLVILAMVAILIWAVAL